MTFKTASIDDFDIAFNFCKQLWTNNNFDRSQILNVYQEVINDPESFAFFIVDNGEYKGFCHGNYFNTFWMSGLSCYVSSLVTDKNERRKGYGRMLMDHAKELAKEKGCKALFLLSGFQRTDAHAFYEAYGFEKGSYGFDLPLD